MAQGTVQVDDTVAEPLRVFVAMLSHLPVEVQRDVLNQATRQVSRAVEQSIA
jgi:hypothetical protein